MFFRAPRETGLVSDSQRGTTPFHRAVASLDNELIAELLDRGALINLHTAANQTAMIIATEARGREEDIIATLRLLRERGAEINTVQKIRYITRDHGGTALHAATEKNARRVMSALVELGADPDVKDEDGLTALDYAMSRGWLPFLTTRPEPRLEIARHLRQLGATVELDRTPEWPGEFPPIGPPRNHESEIWPL
jgi:ankyrin repeat protein